MMELPNKMHNKHNKYVIIESDGVIKLFWNKYVQKNYAKCNNFLFVLLEALKH